MTYQNKKVLFSATVDSHILAFHIPYLKYFKKQGYEVHVASNGTEKIPYTDIKHTISIQRNPFNLKNIYAIFKLKKIIDNEKYNIVHTHTPMGSVVTRLASIRSRKKNNTRIIYTAHGFHFYKGAPPINWLIYFPIEKILSYFTDDLITLNDEDHKYALLNFKGIKNIHKVNGVGVNLSKFRPGNQNNKSMLRNKFGFEENIFIILCVAEFTANKGQEFIVESAVELKKLIPNIKILFAGSGDRIIKTKKLVEKLNLSDVVYFLGYRKDMHNIYKISDIQISASIREGLPINIIEAMASGLPVVCSKIRGHTDLVRDERNGLTYTVRNKDEFLKAIARMYKDSSLIQKAKDINPIDVKIYSQDKVLRLMKKIYEKNDV